MLIPFKKGVMHLDDANLGASYLIGSKCQSCGTVAFPKRVVCHKCLSGNVVEVPLSKRGKLVSFTVARVTPEGITPPVTMGYIDLPEGVRLFAMITGSEPDRDTLEVGQEMELVFAEMRNDQDGNRVVAFKFQPVKES